MCSIPECEVDPERKVDMVMAPLIKARLLMLALCLLILQLSVGAYQITVQRVECVSQFVEHEGLALSGSFVVVEKAYDRYSDREDIKMVATDPSGREIMNIKARGGQQFSYKSSKAGYHKICFYNPTAAPEKVEFVIHVGQVLAPQDLAKDEHFDPVQAKIVQLREALEKVSLEQQYYKARDIRHRRTNESTQNRLLWYTIAEYLALIIASLAQVYLVQRLFSKRIGYNKV